jgi:protein phosphatase
MENNVINLNKDTIIILSGLPGSGKSTFAKKYFKEEQILSSDFFRKLIGGVFNNKGIIVPNQNVSGRAFKLMQELLEERAKHGYLTIIDATNLEWQMIKDWIKIAEKYKRPYLILHFNLDLETIKEWNNKRKEKVFDYVIEKFVEKEKNLYKSEKIQELIKKGLFIEINPKENYNFVFSPKSTNVLEINKEKVLVVGDIHGDLEALNKFIEIAEKENAFIIFLGDFIDRGKESLEVLLKIKDLYFQNKAISLLGNH